VRFDSDGVIHPDFTQRAPKSLAQSNAESPSIMPSISWDSRYKTLPSQLPHFVAQLSMMLLSENNRTGSSSLPVMQTQPPQRQIDEGLMTVQLKKEQVRITTDRAPST
jgi:hypothetical protein